MLGGYLHLQGEPRQTPSRRSSQHRESPHRPTPIGPETPKGGCSYRGSYVQSQRVRGVHKKHLAAWDRGKGKAGRLMPCWSSPAKDKTRDGPLSGEGSFPDLGDTVCGAGPSPHRSKGEQKYRSSPVAVHEKAGAPMPRPDKPRTAVEGMLISPRVSRAATVLRRNRRRSARNGGIAPPYGVASSWVLHRFGDEQDRDTPKGCPSPSGHERCLLSQYARRRQR